MGPPTQHPRKRGARDTWGQFCGTAPEVGKLAGPSPSTATVFQLQECDYMGSDKANKGCAAWEHLCSGILGDSVHGFYLLSNRWPDPHLFLVPHDVIGTAPLQL
ncbi:hypothetical protein CRENBAI_014563 [Crenichthys baileyi]|uniref:Uncharacterized protein n=1 Tax=Crenichthys baileyi TaxID=28760 RepID=A0AAV9SPY3_9TELE